MILVAFWGLSGRPNISNFLQQTDRNGLRPAKIIAHAIFVIRRIQDFAEKHRQPLFMTLLDWEKTFEIDHTCLCEALHRMGLDIRLIEALSDGYKKTATCFVEDEFGKSEKQNSNDRE